MLMDSKNIKFSLIVGAGESIPSAPIFQWLVDHAENILCADGGYDILNARGVEPDLLLGDFDSSQRIQKDAAILKKFQDKNALLQFPGHKDQSDMELALDFLLEKNTRKAAVIGAVGSRLDHSLCNIALVECYALKGLQLELYMRDAILYFLLPGEYELEPRLQDEDTYFSFLTLRKNAQISLIGYEYPLKHHVLEPMTSLGISNHYRKGARVIVEEGAGVYAMETRDGRLTDPIG
ncbi:thiamine diphosphokinase [Peptoniphilaceae bacterium SGI.137]|nr:thiamine diphosphokinase [Peptoniphilaceae bacterium]MDY3986621.1 thiamine diphosphokinase [Peptoniphilaceae bacterium]